MADYIRCKNCDPIYCNGCNIKILETMLDEGKFDCLMNGNRSINQSADVAPVRHGQWVDYGTGYNWCYECSVCGWKDGIHLKIDIIIALTAELKWMEELKMYKPLADSTLQRMKKQRLLSCYV